MLSETKERYIKMDYFRVVSRDLAKPDGTDTLFDLSQWIAIFDKELKELSKRVQPHNGESARLDNFYVTDDGIWVLDFLRMRDGNIPKMAYMDKQSEDIELNSDEYIGEEVIGLYDDSVYILALQRNRNSLSVSGIENYINKTIRPYISETISIHLCPILSNVSIDDVAKNKNNIYKKVRIKLADVANLDTTKYSSSLGSVLRGLKHYDGAYIDITVSMGHCKGNLNNNMVNDTLYKLVSDPNAKKVDLYYKQGETEQVEFVDLLSDKLSDIVYITYKAKQSIPSDLLAQTLLTRYAESKHRIQQILRLK